MRRPRTTVIGTFLASVLVLSSQAPAMATAQPALVPSNRAGAATTAAPVPTPFALLNLSQPGGAGTVTTTLAASASSPPACSAGSPPANQNATTTISPAGDSSSLANLTFAGSAGGGLAFQGPVLETSTRTLELNLSGDSGADLMSLTGYGTTFTGPGSVTDGPCSFTGTVTVTLPGTGLTLAPLTLTLVDATSGVPYTPNDQECNRATTPYAGASGLTCAAFDPARQRDVEVGDAVGVVGTGFNPWAGNVSVSFDGVAAAAASASVTGKFQARFNLDEPASKCAGYVAASQFNAKKRAPLVLTYDAQVWAVAGTVHLPHFSKPLVTGQGICEQGLGLYNLLSPAVKTGAGVIIAPFVPGAADDTAAGGTAVPGGQTGWSGWVASGRWNPYSGVDITVVSRPPGVKPITFVATLVVNSLSIQMPGSYFNDPYNLYQAPEVLDAATTAGAAPAPRFDTMVNVEASTGPCSSTNQQVPGSNGHIVLVTPPECYFTPDGDFPHGLTLNGGRLMYLFSPDHTLDVYEGMSVAGRVSVNAFGGQGQPLQAIVVKGGLEAVGGGWNNTYALVLSGRALVVKG